MVSRRRLSLARSTPRRATSGDGSGETAGVGVRHTRTRHPYLRPVPRARVLTVIITRQPTYSYPGGPFVSMGARIPATEVAARASPPARRSGSARARPIASIAPARRVRLVGGRASSDASEAAARSSPDRCKGGARSGDDRFPVTESTALALLPRSTSLTPLMDRLRAPARVFAYPDLNVELTIAQRWDESGAGTGAAVWDSAELLARCIAETGAISALREHPTAARTVRDVDDARAWWRGKTVVELGAGLGLTSLVVASAGALALCTDGDERVVRMCAENADANARNVRRARAADEREGARRRVPPLAARLLWGDEEDAAAAEDWIRTANDAARDGDVDDEGDGDADVEGESSESSDRLDRVASSSSSSSSTSTSSSAHPAAILLADAVYGERSESWRALAETLRRLSGPETLVAMSHTRRGNGASDAFFDMARDAGFRVRRAERWVENRDGATSVTSLYAMFLEER